MREYADFELEDFVADDYFCDWVLNPDAENEIFWNAWVASHPWKANTIDAARRLVLQIERSQSDEPYHQELQESWQAIKKKTLHKKKTVWNFKALGIAATISLTLVMATIYLINRRVESPSNQAGALQPGFEWVDVENNDEKVQEFLLEDGSSISLEPNGNIQFPSSFAAEHREVKLNGEAFFDIKHDTNRPFVIYTEQTMVKVLGTSFKLKAKDGDSEVKVTVKSGKVAIYPIGISNDDFNGKFDHTPIIATANQQVTYDGMNNNFKKKLSSKPQLILPKENFKMQQFDEVNLSEILKALQEAYGVIFQYEENQLENCLITTTFMEESLFERLNILAEVAGISYYEDKGIIVITGKCD